MSHFTSSQCLNIANCALDKHKKQTSQMLDKVNVDKRQDRYLCHNPTFARQTIIV